MTTSEDKFRDEIIDLITKHRAHLTWSEVRDVLDDILDRAEEACEIQGADS